MSPWPLSRRTYAPPTGSAGLIDDGSLHLARARRDRDRPLCRRRRRGRWAQGKRTPCWSGVPRDDATRAGGKPSSTNAPLASALVTGEPAIVACGASHVQHVAPAGEPWRAPSRVTRSDATVAIAWYSRCERPSTIARRMLSDAAVALREARRRPGLPSGGPRPERPRRPRASHRDLAANLGERDDRFASSPPAAQSRTTVSGAVRRASDEHELARRARPAIRNLPSRSAFAQPLARCHVAAPAPASRSRGAADRLPVAGRDTADEHGLRYELEVEVQLAGDDDLLPDRSITVGLDADARRSVIQGRPVVATMHTLYFPVASESVPLRPATETRAFAIPPPDASAITPVSRDRQSPSATTSWSDLHSGSTFSTEAATAAKFAAAALTVKVAAGCTPKSNVPSAAEVTSAIGCSTFDIESGMSNAGFISPRRRARAAPSRRRSASRETRRVRRSAAVAHRVVRATRGCRRHLGDGGMPAAGSSHRHASAQLAARLIVAATALAPHGAADQRAPTQINTTIPITFFMATTPSAADAGVGPGNAGKRNERREPTALGLIGALAQSRRAADRAPTLRRRRTVPSGMPSRRAISALLQPFDEVQQHGRAIRLGEREQLFGERALQLDAFDELGRRRHRSIVVGRGMALVAPRIAPPARANEVGDDAREPRPQRPIEVRLLLGRDEPRVLRDVVGERVVLHQRARELRPRPSRPSAARSSESARRPSLHLLSAAARQIVRDNSLG